MRLDTLNHGLGTSLRVFLFAFAVTLLTSCKPNYEKICDKYISKLPPTKEVVYRSPDSHCIFFRSVEEPALYLKNFLKEGDDYRTLFEPGMTVDVYFPYVTEIGDSGPKIDLLTIRKYNFDALLKEIRRGDMEVEMETLGDGTGMLIKCGSDATNALYYSFRRDRLFLLSNNTHTEFLGMEDGKVKCYARGRLKKVINTGDLKADLGPLAVVYKNSDYMDLYETECLIDDGYVKPTGTIQFFYSKMPYESLKPGNTKEIAESIKWRCVDYLWPSRAEGRDSYRGATTFEEMDESFNNSVVDKYPLNGAYFIEAYLTGISRYDNGYKIETAGGKLLYFNKYYVFTHDESFVKLQYPVTAYFKAYFVAKRPQFLGMGEYECYFDGAQLCYVKEKGKVTRYYKANGFFDYETDMEKAIRKVEAQIEDD